MRDRPIVITESDAAKLSRLLSARTGLKRDRDHLDGLRAELERALVLEPEQVPRDVVTMHTRVQMLDLKSGERRELVLVFPAEADVGARRISVLAPLGTALLGYREGDEIEWIMPGGLRRLHIERVLQPHENGSASASEASPTAAFG